MCFVTAIKQGHSPTFHSFPPLYWLLLLGQKELASFSNRKPLTLVFCSGNFNTRLWRGCVCIGPEPCLLCASLDSAALGALKSSLKAVDERYQCQSHLAIIPWIWFPSPRLPSQLLLRTWIHFQTTWLPTITNSFFREELRIDLIWYLSHCLAHREPMKRAFEFSFARVFMLLLFRTCLRPLGWGTDIGPGQSKGINGHS
jgi:hypothetical protein